MKSLEIGIAGIVVAVKAEVVRRSILAVSHSQGKRQNDERECAAPDHGHYFVETLLATSSRHENPKK
jgi:hypothetical protein